MNQPRNECFRCNLKGLQAEKRTLVLVEFGSGIERLLCWSCVMAIRAYNETQTDDPAPKYTQGTPKGKSRTAQDPRKPAPRKKPNRYRRDS